MDRRLAVFTGESAWLVTTNEEGTTGYVNARASFGYHMPTDHDYHGHILTGDNGLNLRVGTRIVFSCQCEARHDGYPGGNGIVASGIITRVVNFADIPEPERVQEVSEDVTFITIKPSWKWLMPHVPVAVADEFDRALGLADILVALADMGRITQEDLQAARERVAASTL